MYKVANLKSRPSEGFFTADPKYKQNIYLIQMSQIKVY
jgi:hypothetical protein